MRVDLDSLEELPEFEIKLKNNVYKFKPLELIFEIQKQLSGEMPDDPKVLCNAIVKAVDLDLSFYQALAVMAQLIEFSQTDLDTVVKKVFGRTLFSTTTTTSPSEPTSDSPDTNVGA